MLLGADQVVAGSFRPDPAFGYPAGAPAGIPEHVGATSTGHAVGFEVAVAAWVALLVVLAVALRHTRGWAVSALVLATGLLIVPAVSTMPFGTVVLYVVVSIGFLHTSAVHAHLASGPRWSRSATPRDRSRPPTRLRRSAPQRIGGPGGVSGRCCAPAPRRPAPRRRSART